MKITTNNQPRQFIYGHDVPQSILDDYDYLDPDEAFDGWIKYKDTYYHISDFSLATHEFKEWDGIYYATAFSGVLIKVEDYADTYIIATYTT